VKVKITRKVLDDDFIDVIVSSPDVEIVLPIDTNRAKEIKLSGDMTVRHDDLGDGIKCMSA
jgi:hypothetical protein